MRAQLSDTTHQLAAILWQKHTVYRDRTGGMVIRADHIHRWISLASTGTRGEVLIRAGRLLDGGTTAPARAETVMPLSSGTGELAAACRRLLADTATAAATTGAEAPRSRPARQRRPVKKKVPKKRGVSSRLVVAVLAGAATLVALASYGAMASN